MCTRLRVPHLSRTAPKHKQAVRRRPERGTATVSAWDSRLQTPALALSLHFSVHGADQIARHGQS